MKTTICIKYFVGFICLVQSNLIAQVGIGTTGPSEILDLESSSATKTALDINNTGGGDPMIHFQLSGTATFTMGIDNSDADKFKIGTTALETNNRLTIDASGNIGVNDESPTYKFDLTGGSVNVYPSTASTDFYRYNDLHALSMPNTNNLYVGDGAGAAFNAGGTDNTFIGYNAGAANTTGDFNTFIGDNSGAGTSAGGSNTYIGASAGANFSGSTNVCLGFAAGPASGNANSDLLFIDNSANDSPLIWGDFSANEIVINGNGGDDGGLAYNFFVNGEAGGSAAWNNLSDRRLKTNIETISNPMQKVLALRGVNYNWRDTLKRGSQLELGFIAQEVLEIIPEVVNVPKDTVNGTFSMSYAPITALLVEAMKEQEKIIIAQKAEMILQKKELNELKAFVSEIKQQQEKIQAELVLKSN